MSYGKDDFLHWDDDIDSLLGDYTCSEIELTDDDEPSTNKKKQQSCGSLYEGLDGGSCYSLITKNLGIYSLSLKFWLIH